MENMDRYRQAIAGCGVATDEEAVRSAVARIKEKAVDYDTEDVRKLILSCIDLTTLSSEDSERSVAAFTGKVNEFDNAYPQYPHVASICVYSNFAEVVKEHLDVEGVEVCVVAAGFPSSQTFQAVKVADVAMAREAGAQEIDIVMNLGMLLDGNYLDLSDEMIELKHMARGAKLKVILETGALKSAELVKAASVLAMYSEADFIKTSTGKVYPGASLEAAWVMCSCIKDYYRKTGRKVGFKAAGGIRTTAEAVEYYAVVKEVLGDEWLTPELFRIGASSLANAVLSSLEGEEVKFF